MIPRSARRPTRRQSRNILGSMSLVFFTIFALILLCPVAVNAADEDKKSEFGTVIGIGKRLPLETSFPQGLFTWPLRSRHNVFLCWVSLNDCDVSCKTAGLRNMNSVQRGGRVEIIANDQGHRITPSWVSFSDEERLCVFLSSAILRVTFLIVRLPL